MLRYFVIASIGSLGLAVPAAAQDAAPAADPQSKQVCKREVPTGSVRAKRTCRTKAEWDALEARARADMDKINAMDRSRSSVGTYRGS